MGEPMEPFSNEINDEMLKNLYNSFQHCQNDFGKMDFKCEEEIIITSWNFMKNSIKKNEFCHINEINVENPIRSFVYDILNVKINDQFGINTCQYNK